MVYSGYSDGLGYSSGKVQLGTVATNPFHAVATLFDCQKFTQRTGEHLGFDCSDCCVLLPALPELDVLRAAIFGVPNSWAAAGIIVPYGELG